MQGTAAKHISSDFGVRLKKLCKERHISQKELARITGLSTSAISSYVCGTRRPKLETLYTIAQALDIPEKCLFKEDSAGAELVRSFTVVLRNVGRLSHIQRTVLVEELVKADVKPRCR